MNRESAYAAQWLLHDDQLCARFQISRRVGYKWVACYDASRLTASATLR